MSTLNIKNCTKISVPTGGETRPAYINFRVIQLLGIQGRPDLIQLINQALNGLDLEMMSYQNYHDIVSVYIDLINTV